MKKFITILLIILSACLFAYYIFNANNKKKDNLIPSKTENQEEFHYTILNETISGSFVVGQDKKGSKQIIFYYTLIVGNGDNKTYSENVSAILLGNTVLYEDGNAIASGPTRALLGKMEIQNHKNSNFLNYNFDTLNAPLLDTSCKVMPFFSVGQTKGQVLLHPKSYKNSKPLIRYTKDYDSLEVKLFISNGIQNASRFNMELILFPGVCVKIKNRKIDAILQ